MYNIDKNRIYTTLKEKYTRYNPIYTLVINEKAIVYTVGIDAQSIKFTQNIIFDNAKTEYIYDRFCILTDNLINAINRINDYTCREYIEYLNNKIDDEELINE